MAAVLKKRALAEYGSLTQVIEPPWKRFKISILKRKSDDAGTTYFNLLKTCKKNNEAFKILLNIPESLKLTSEELQNATQLLCEHFHKQNDSAVRAKILSIFCFFGQTQEVNNELLLNSIIKLIDLETSHKVIAQCLHTMLVLSMKLNISFTMQSRLFEVAKKLLNDTNQYVKRLCLQLIESVHGVEKELLISSYIHNEDSRVRRTALEVLVNLNKKVAPKDSSLYNDVASVLNDDYDTVRVAALELISLIGNAHPDFLINSHQNGNPVRLIDDAFIKLCQAVNDSSTIVRITAVHLLGTMMFVSKLILNQTLDKKLMTNLKKRESYKERTSRLLTSSDWLFRNKWSTDSSSGFYLKDEVSFQSNGSCGALIQGLEDDSMEIRIAAVKTLCSLALTHQEFAIHSLDYLVEMLSDEIEAVRLEAIKCLSSLGHLVVLKKYQIEIIISALEDSSFRVRENLQNMIASCKLSSKECLQLIIERLLDNLKKYPQDKNVTWESVKELGNSHADLILPIIPRLLGLHPFFDTAEPNIENPCYITLLILVFNAAEKCPTAISLFEECTIKHYTYLRAAMPSFVPLILFKDNDEYFEADVDPISSFLCKLINDVSTTSSGLNSILPHLKSLTKIESPMSGMIHFITEYFSCQALLNKIKKCRVWNSNNFTQISLNTMQSDILLLLSQSLKLQHLFLGLKKCELELVKKLQLISFVVFFILKVKFSKLTCFDDSYHLFNEIKQIQHFLSDKNIAPCLFSEKVFSALEMSKYTRPLELSNHFHHCISSINIINLPRLTQDIQMCRGLLTVPSTSPDAPLKFTAGLVLAVKVEARLFALQNSKNLRVKVCYPNSDVQYFSPTDSDLQSMSTDGEYRLLIDILLYSHSSWSEACFVEISLCIDFSTGKPSDWRGIGLDPFLELCKPQKLYIRSRPVMKSLHRGLL